MKVAASTILTAGQWLNLGTLDLFMVSKKKKQRHLNSKLLNAQTTHRNIK